MRQKTSWLMTGVFGLALVLRAWGLDYGLPYIYHPDEPAYITLSQQIFQTGDLNPHFFNYPSLHFYLNALAYAPYFLLGKLLGVFSSPESILAPMTIAMGVSLAPLPTSVLLGRCITLMFSLGSVMLVYWIGMHLTDLPLTGLLAAFMMAVSPTNVDHSRYITPNTLVMFWVLAAFAAAVLVYKHGSTWSYLLAGICVGLAAGSKYNGALIGLAPVLAHLLRTGKDGWRDIRLYLLPLISIIAFLISTPYALLDYSAFIEDLKFEAEHYMTGHAGSEGDTLRVYLNFLWLTTGPISFLAVVEILRGAFHRVKSSMLLAVFPLVYFAFINRFVVRNDQTIMLMTPFLFLLAESLLVYWHQNLTGIKPVRWRRLLQAGWVGLVLITLFLPGIRTVRAAARLATPDSRQNARIWVEQNIPAGATIGLESYAPYCDPQVYSIQAFGRLNDNPPEWYIRQGFDYLIFSEGMFGRFFADPERYAMEVDAYKTLFARFYLVKEFHDGGYEIYIYQVHDS